MCKYTCNICCIPSCNGYVCLFVFMLIIGALYTQFLLLQPSEHNSEVLSLSSQESVQEGETSQEWQPTPQVEHKLQSLNNFLRRTLHRSISPVRSQCKSDVLTISASTQRYYRRKAEQVVDVVLDAIAPGNSTWLFEQVRSRHEIIQGVSNAGEGTLVSRLVTCYEEVGSWYNRQQILSLFASDYSKTELLQMILALPSGGSMRQENMLSRTSLVNSSSHQRCRGRVWILLRLITFWILYLAPHSSKTWRMGREISNYQLVRKLKFQVWCAPSFRLA